MEGFSEPLASHGAWEYDPATEAVEWSDAVYRIHGVAPESFDAAPERIRELIHPDDLDMYARIFHDALGSHRAFTVQHRIVRPDGAVRTVVVRGAAIAAGNGAGAARIIGTIQDVTGRPGYEERLWHLANEDSLTGLFNRRRFMEELAREVAVARRSRRDGAVLMLDLDRFKEVNDSLGHMAGDMLLTKVAGALRTRLRSTDTLARLGGDEFALVLPGCPLGEARQVAANLLESLAGGVTTRIAGRERRVTASIGLAPFGTRDEETADTLLVEADLAMYRAKAYGPGEVEIFDEEMRAELAERLRIEAELRGAIEQGQLRVVYQPIVALGDGVPVGCEALARWVHPERGVVSPAEFIPIAEEYGLIGEIGHWVLEQACMQAAEWRRSGHNAYVSVNVSPAQLVGEDIVATVGGVLAASGLPPQLVCLEMTETSLLEDARPMLPALSGLKRLGVRLAIDDFGGGSSSFALLRMLPLDVIKIDRVFIEGLAERPDDRAIVAAVLSLAEELEMTVIAEGVEEDRQHWELCELGCPYGQGFRYAEPSEPSALRLDGYSMAIQPGVGDPTVIREFMRQIGIPARVGS